jgi:hypothetical protein
MTTISYVLEYGLSDLNAVLGQSFRAELEQLNSINALQNPKRRKLNEDSLCLEALAVDNVRTNLIVFLAGDQHLREPAEPCKD